MTNWVRFKPTHGKGMCNTVNKLYKRRIMSHNESDLVWSAAKMRRWDNTKTFNYCTFIMIKVWISWKQAIRRCLLWHHQILLNLLHGEFSLQFSRFYSKHTFSYLKMNPVPTWAQKQNTVPHKAVGNVQLPTELVMTVITVSLQHIYNLTVSILLEL